MQVNPQKKLFAFIIFNPNVKMLLPTKMMGLLSWHQYERDLFNHAPPTVSVQPINSQ